METSSFLIRPQGDLGIVSWNINSVRTKIEKTNVESVLRCYDIICLNEIKTSLSVSFPGYIPYISYDKANGNRGGTCVFIKRYLMMYVFDVDLSIADQVWFKLKCVPGVLFGACYIPPSDSEYFSYSQLSCIQEKIKSSECINGCLIIGDMNTRFGMSVCDLPGQINLSQYSYPIIPDPIATANDNATTMLGICVDKHLLVVNNLKTPKNISQAIKPTEREGNGSLSWIHVLYLRV